MLVYVVSYDGKWKIEEYDSRYIHYIKYDYIKPENTRYTLYREKIGHYGYIWNGRQIYTTREGALAYINKQYDVADKYLWDELRYNK